ncbi:hypothetical protein ILUMI_09675 [Ignelater luminosus]|uniref:Uncharacterized protein n=1 Tax=Ignelater luminosus TaxID=2038154 RepID=A0A8K0D8N6_IGNLU|nr:hypothetical protein ILUMI_09675 [Ignelater luminosus]
MTVRLLVDRSEELEMIVDVSKFLSNEYRFFPIHFEVNWCKAFEVNMAGFRNALKCGNFFGCPMEKNKTYHVCNWVPDESKYPPGIPTGQYRIRNYVMLGSEEVTVFDGYIDIVNSMYIF